MESDQEWLMFNGFIFPLLPQLYYRADGRAGERILMINDEEETFSISFEQGMECLDLLQTSSAERPKIYSEYRKDDRYLHQCKVFAQDGTAFKDIVYFHMELTDTDGTVHICPGQMFISPALRQSDGVEPLLLQLLNGTSVYKAKGGG
ncbi:MAG: hypothetical protein J6A71_06755 [Anaerotignum sp.]|nr:hypothetical protein [Anaerotignum sp.]